MSQDCTPLALDDLVHLMSPSPAPQSPQDNFESLPRAESASPEPLPGFDVFQMRRKVVEMRHVDKPDALLTPREKELAEMVLKLTAVVRPDPNQLHRQAELISALTQQRDLLLYQAEEQRLRWSSEKDSWARMAEALLTQQAKNRSNPERDEDFERLHTAESDNKTLRQRLNETQSRLQMLESEFTRLRPLLLMQPLISRSSIPPPTPNPKIQHARRRKKDAVTTEDEEHGASDDEGPIDPLDTPSHTSHSQATPRAKSRKSEVPSNLHPATNVHKRRPSQKATSRSLSADARAEHLLLAARKIGKHRAGIISGMVHHLEEQEQEWRREESAMTAVATTPKTPKRNASRTGYPPDGGYVYLNGQVQPGPGMQPVPLYFPAYSHHLLQTPSSSATAPSVTSSARQSAQKTKQDARSNNPPTPLDSLLSAARSMMHEDVDAEVDNDGGTDVVGGSPAKTASSRLARHRDMLGSPVPKRRKISPRTDKPTAQHESTTRAGDNPAASSSSASGAANAGVGRLRSALDVLADQAAVFSSQEQSIAPSQTQAQAQKKGKGKERLDDQSQESPSSTPRPRERAKPRGKEPEVEAPSSAAPTPRSMTPRSDSGDNPTDSTSPAPLGAGGSTSEAPVDPGGGTSGAPTSYQSSQALDPISTSGETQVTVTSDAPDSRIPDTPLAAKDAGNTTPRQSFRVQSTPGHEKLDGPHAAIAQPSLTPLTLSLLESEPRGAPPLPQYSEKAPFVGENDGSSGLAPTTSVTAVKHRELVRVVDQDVPTPAPPTKRQRSPYVKWSKEEDDLLAQAVAKYGQKWDLVQKALPSRGYHQVRQRWLRKLGVFDSKPDLSSFQTAATTFSSASRGDGVEPRGNPKLGLAPLSSERAFSGLVGRPPSLPS